MCSALFAMAKGADFKLPTIPDSVQGSNARAEYLCEHFWDDAPNEAKYDYSILHTYLYALSRIPVPRQSELLGNRLDESLPDEKQFAALSLCLDETLGNPFSKLRNDTLYLDMQQRIVDSSLDDVNKIVPRWRIEFFRRTWPGMKAADIELTDSHGRTILLSQIGRPLVLIFANSECSLCREELPRIIDELNNSGKRWIVVYVDGYIPDYALRNYSDNAYADSVGSIIDEEAYMTRMLPCAYEIDSEGRIMAREIQLIK